MGCSASKKEKKILALLRVGLSGVRILGRALDCILFLKTSKAALESTQPPIQWETGFLSWGQSSRVMNLTTHLHLLPMLRTNILIVRSGYMLA
jgi:hypothetical protein